MPPHRGQRGTRGARGAPPGTPRPAASPHAYSQSSSQRSWRQQQQQSSQDKPPSRAPGRRGFQGKHQSEKRSMELIASVSRSSGLEKDGDALRDPATQEDYRAFIQDKVEEYWSKYPLQHNRDTVDCEDEEARHNRREMEGNLLILFRKLREGLLSTQRRDAFALEVYETSLHLSVLFKHPNQKMSAEQRTSALSHLFPDLYITIGANASAPLSISTPTSGTSPRPATTTSKPSTTKNVNNSSDKSSANSGSQDPPKRTRAALEEKTRAALRGVQSHIVASVPHSARSSTLILLLHHLVQDYPHQTEFHTQLRQLHPALQDVLRASPAVTSPAPAALPPPRWPGSSSSPSPGNDSANWGLSSTPSTAHFSRRPNAVSAWTPSAIPDQNPTAISLSSPSPSLPSRCPPSSPRMETEGVPLPSTPTSTSATLSLDRSRSGVVAPLTPSAGVGAGAGADASADSHSAGASAASSSSMPPSILSGCTRHGSAHAHGHPLEHSSAYVWIVDLARCLLTRNYTQLDRLTRRAVYSRYVASTRLPNPSPVPAAHSHAYTLSRTDADAWDAHPKVVVQDVQPELALEAVGTLVEMLLDKARATTWAILRTAYREVSLRAVPSPAPHVGLGTDRAETTGVWLARSLVLWRRAGRGEIGSGDMGVADLEKWLEERAQAGEARRKEGEGMEGRWILVRMREDEKKDEKNKVVGLPRARMRRIN